jgi:hypothetical protein
LKKLAIIGMAITAMLAMAAVAMAQVAPPVIQWTASASPAKAGTKKKPKNTKLKTAFNVNADAKKTLSGINYYIPKEIKLSGKGFKKCSADTINTSGEGACPKGSQVGAGTSTALLGPSQAPLNFNVKVFANGANEIALSLTGSVPIAFKAPIKKASGKYGQKIEVQIPASVQQPNPGLFSYVTNVTTTIGGAKVKTGKGKKKKTLYFSGISSCPKSKKVTSGVQLVYAQNDTGPAGQSDIVTSTASCKK